MLSKSAFCFERSFMLDGFVSFFSVSRWTRARLQNSVCVEAYASKRRTKLETSRTFDSETEDEREYEERTNEIEKKTT